MLGHAHVEVWDAEGAQYLSPAMHLWDYSGGTLDWVGEPEPRQQLALALLWDAAGAAEICYAEETNFREQVLDLLPTDAWGLSEIAILRWVAERYAHRLGLPLSFALAEYWGGAACEN